MDFFGVGLSELFFIAFFCLIFFKPEELPSIIRTIVSHIKKFRSVTAKVQKDIGDIYHREIESKFEEAKEDLTKSTYAFHSGIKKEYQHFEDQVHTASHVANQELKTVMETSTPTQASAPSLVQENAPSAESIGSEKDEPKSEPNASSI